MTQAPQPNVLITVAPALIAAAVALVVLIMTDILTRARESRARRQAAARQYRERQLGEFYGPLLSLIEQIQSVYAVKTKLLRAAKDRLSPEQKERVEHYFWVTHFNPLHVAVRDLFRTRLYLLEKGKAPASFDTYFTHSVQEKAQKEIASDLGIDTSFLEGVPYPRDFDTNVKATVDELMETYGRDIERLKA
jgi:hypothetical protein